MSDAGTITVTRPADGRRDRLRSYRLKVDGSGVSAIKRGQTQVIPVSAGHHAVRASIDGYGSSTVRVVVPENGDVELVVRPGGSAWTIFADLWHREGYLTLTPTTVATSASEPPDVSSKGRLLLTIALAMTGLAGVFLVVRGVARLVHDGFASAGAGYIGIGLLCYAGAVIVSRRLRRHDAGYRPRP